MASAISSSDYGVKLAASEKLVDQLTTRLADSEGSDPPSTPCNDDCEVKLAASEKLRTTLEDEVKRLQTRVS